MTVYKILKLYNQDNSIRYSVFPYSLNFMSIKNGICYPKRNIAEYFCRIKNNKNNKL